MTRLTKKDEEQMGAGCVGLILGGIICGLTGFAIGLLFLTATKAIGLGILTALIGAAIVGCLFYKAMG